MLEPSGTVFVVEDDYSLREALSALIRSVGMPVQVFASAAEFLKFERPDTPCCLVLDVRLPGLSGLDLQRELLSSGHRIPVIFMTAHGDIPMTVRAMKAGAVEFLPKPFREQELLDAIRVAIERDRTSRHHNAEVSRIERRTSALTQREHQVMKRLLAGLRNKQVAAELGVTEVTVKIHRRNILRKMNVSSLVELERLVEKLR